MAKKIMFSDKFGLTEAVLSGRKTQTRRIIKPQPEVSERMGMVWKGYAYGITSPAGSPFFLKDVYENFLSGTDYPQDHRYKVGEVVAVAQSYKDCGYAPAALDRSPKDLNVVRGTLGESKGWYSTPREAYAALIDRISGKGTWESNPYVFVYEFELIK